MSEKRIPAETFPPGDYLKEELEARGWDEQEFIRQLFLTGCDGMGVLACLMVLYVHDKNLITDQTTASHLGRCLGTSPELWINLDRAYRGVT